MAWYLAVYQGLVHSALTGLLLLAVAALAVLGIREPVRRIRAIELTLCGLVLLPLLALVPGYPRWSILPSGAVGRMGPARDSVQATPPDAAPAPTNLQLFEGQTAAPAEPPLVVPTLTPEDAIAVGVETIAVTKSESPDREHDAMVVEASLEDPVTPEAKQANGVSMPSHFEIAPLARHGAEPGLYVDFRYALVLVYLAGVGAMAGWSLLGLLAVRRLLRSTRPASAACRAMLREIAGPASDRVALLVSPRANQPCAFAWRPTTIVLPEHLCGTESPQRLRWALAHEWSHVERGDVWSWTASGVVRWFYFYQPLVWWLRQRLQLCQDFVADARSAGAMSEDYAEFLASCSIGFAQPSLAAGLGIGGRISDLQRRVVMLVERRRPLETVVPRRWTLVALPFAALAVAVVAGLGEQRVVAEPQGKPVAAPVQKTDPVTPVPAIAPAAAVRPVGPLANDPFSTDSELLPPAEPVEVAEATPPTEKPNDGRRIAPGDRLGIEIIVAPEDNLLDKHMVPANTAINDRTPTYARNVPNGDHVRSNRVETDFIVQPDGELSFGPICGRVAVAGLTEIEAEQAIVKILSKTFMVELPKVQLVIHGHVNQGPPRDAPWRIHAGDRILIDAVGNKPDHGLTRTETVDAEGVRLGAAYGRLKLVGLTPRQAEDALLQHLKNSFEDPKVAIVLVNYTSPRKSKTPAPPQSTQPAVPAIYPPVPLQGPAGSTRPAAAKANAPSRIAPNDALSIIVVGAPIDLPLRETFVVEPDGNVPLGAFYGRVNLKDKTISEAEQAILAHLSKLLPGAKVQVARAGRGDWLNRRPTEVDFRIRAGDNLEIDTVQKPVSGTSFIQGRRGPIKESFTVEPEGTIALGPIYGRIRVEGMTIREAEDALRDHLAARSVKDPQVQIRSTGYSIVAAAPTVEDGAPVVGATTFGNPIPQVAGTIVAIGAPATYQPSNVVPASSKPGQLAGVPEGYAIVPAPKPVLIQPLDTIEVTFEPKKGHRNISGIYLVEPNGDIALPFGIGRVNLKGRDLKQAGAAIRWRVSGKVEGETAFSPVAVARRGRALFPDENTPTDPYRIRKGDRLALYIASDQATELEVGEQGHLMAISRDGQVEVTPDGDRLMIGEDNSHLLVAEDGSITIKDKLSGKNVALKFEGRTLAEAQDLINPAGAPPICLTLGGWNEDVPSRMGGGTGMF